MSGAYILSLMVASVSGPYQLADSRCSLPSCRIRSYVVIGEPLAASERQRVNNLMSLRHARRRLDGLSRCIRSANSSPSSLASWAGSCRDIHQIRNALISGV